MSGSDVRDILELGKSCEQQQPRRVKQPTEKRPEGISRELYSLIGKASTVVLPRTPVRAKFNPKKRATPWTLQTCRNEARSDDLSIERWTKVTAPAEAVLHYQKFGESIEVIEYTDEEYETLLQNIDDDWTKEETDYLLHLCRLYRVRFPVIQDRYNFRGKSRPLEELKDRYFKICRILVKSRTPTMSDETIEHQYGYDKEKEIERRTALSTLWGLTRDQMDEEEQLLQETQRIEQNQARLARYKENAMQMLSQLDAAAAALKVKYPKKGQKGKRRIATEDTMTEEKMIPGVHVRSQRLPAVKPQYQTKVMGVMSILGVGPRPVMPTAKVCDTFEHLQNSITAMLELKKVVDNMEFEHNIEKSLRDSSPKRRRRK